jgi:hypothetical protein
MTALGLAGCDSFQQRLRFLDLSAGAELSDARFYVRGGAPERALSSRDVNYDGTIDLNREQSKLDYFYSVGFFPSPVPFVGSDGIGEYMRMSFTLNSPRTFRGTLHNYPDDGRVTTNPMTATTNLLFPLPDALGRRTEFVFEEYRAYITLFFPHFRSENWYFGIGHSFGQSRYNLDLLEGTNRVASSRNAWMALHALQVVYGYRIGRFFEEGLFHQTYLYFELIADSPNRTRLDVNLQRADGLPAASLYYRNTYTRIGIRKTVDLWTTDRVVKEREEIEKKLEEEDRRADEEGAEEEMNKEEEGEEVEEKEKEKIEQEKAPEHTPDEAKDPL